MFWEEVKAKDRRPIRDHVIGYDRAANGARLD
jgi:hypothetical protein